MSPVRLVSLCIIILTSLYYSPSVCFSQVLNPSPYNDVEDTYIYHDYATTLNKIVTKDGLVRYKYLLNNRKYLDRFILSLESIDPKEYEFWTDEDCLAFWLNIYNALSLRIIIDNYPLTDLKKKQYLWNKNDFIIMGKKMSLEHIKQDIIRKKFNDPRIYMALCNGTKSSGILSNKPYIGNKIFLQLAQQTQIFLEAPNNFEIVLNDSQIYISPLFEIYGKDFIKKYGTDKKYKGLKKSERAVMNFIENYLSPEKRNFLYSKVFFIDFNEYNWQLNDIHNIRTPK